MKKLNFKKVLVLLTVVALFITGCGSDKAANADKVIRVGAVPTPHAEILKYIAEDLKAQGYTLEVIEYNDYVLPNTALESGELDANYFQHKPYLDNFNQEQGTHIVEVAKVHFEPFGIYAGKKSSLEELEDGSTIAVPNDSTNEARALLLLEAQGLIKLKDDAGITATVVDIVENPKNLQIKELEAAQVARALADVDVACINGNYAIEAGLKVSDAIAVEDPKSLAAQTYANFVAVKQGNENSEKTKALVKAIQSDKVKEYINNTYNNAVIPVF